MGSRRTASAGPKPPVAAKRVRRMSGTFSYVTLVCGACGLQGHTECRFGDADTVHVYDCACGRRNTYRRPA